MLPSTSTKGSLVLLAALLLVALAHASDVSADTVTTSPDTADTTCYLYSTCSGCIAQNCGWCSSTNQCMSGGSSGSTSGTCTYSGSDDSTNDWWWTSCPSTSTCGSHGSCSSCVGASSCGWCGGTQQTCMGSTSGGSPIGCYNTWNWASCGTSGGYGDDDGYVAGGGLGWTIGAFVFLVVVAAVIRAICWRNYWRRRRYLRQTVNNTYVVPGSQQYAAYQGGGATYQPAGATATYQPAGTQQPTWTPAAGAPVPALPQQQYAYQQPAMQAPPAYAPPPSQMPSEFPPASAPRV